MDDPAAAMSQCKAILAALPRDGSGGSQEASVRAGDVYALMVEYFYHQRNMTDAYAALSEMVGRQIGLGAYLDGGMVAAICQAVGRPSPMAAQQQAQPAAAAAHYGGDDIAEEIAEEGY